MNFLDQYDYTLPEGLIANEPAEPRDSARLLVYHTKYDDVELRQVKELPQLLADSHLVYNDTTVLPARIKGVGEGNKEVELLILVDQGFSETGEVRALVNRFTPINEVIRVSGHTLTVLDNKEKSMLLKFSGAQTDLEKLLESGGETPLPPYISSKATETEKRKQYQTIFASGNPSVAAPTASLHFTPELIENLQEVGTTFSPVTLQVGLGTFAPIFAENFRENKLHTEYYSISKDSAVAIKHAKENKRPIVAVGTTVVRTLESAKAAVAHGDSSFGATDIFIYPPYSFTVPDILMTNFHFPSSSLMCLVDAFLQDKHAKRNIMDLYKIAIKEKFRFYSFGDAMLIL